MAIVIPVYKPKLSENEKRSLAQCAKIFPNRQVIFCAPQGLNLAEYRIENSEAWQTAYFEAKYFTNVAAYNELLLSKHFYEKFSGYDFILIYQLDAWVFADELDYWCKKDYSYIGAPWFTNFSTSETSKKLWAVGNGGFSLRKIKDFLVVLNTKEKVFSLRFLWDKYRAYSWMGRLLRLPKIIFQYYFRNNTLFLYDLFGENEDHFWSFHAKTLQASFKIAPVMEAVSFAFECKPQKMFELNKNKLPFGIHAWEKYDPVFVESVLFKS